MAENRHRAVDGLVNLLTKSSCQLSMVQHKLEHEFQRVYPDSENPMKLLARIKKIQQGVPSLQSQCRELLTAKQELIDIGKTALLGNTNFIRRLQASVSLPISSADDPAYSNFSQIIDEWTDHVTTIKDDDISEDLNDLLFSAVLRVDE